MARPLRIEYAEAWYHVMNRGAGYRPVFRTDQHRQEFLSLLGDITGSFSTEVHAYCLMDNHYHLLVKTPLANLSRAMRHLNGVYTIRYNRSEKTDGPLFRGRYKAILVDADSYLRQVSRYIHRNPLEAGMTAELSTYQWSSYGAYIGIQKPAVWLHTNTVLCTVAARHRQVRYRAFVEQGLDVELAAFYTKVRLPPVLGSDEFQRSMRAEYQTDDREIVGQKDLIAPASIAAVVELVARAFDVSTDTIVDKPQGRPTRNVARAVAMALCRTPCGHRLTAIAAAFGACHYSSVSVAISRLKVNMRQDGNLTRQVERLAMKIR